MTHVLANIRAEMARRGLDQGDLGACLGLSRNSVSERLTGKTKISVDELLKIADLLNVAPGELVSLT